MPPKAKFTKEEIISVAFEMMRKNGTEVLSARSLAKELGTSTAPIFTVFSSIDEVLNGCLAMAKALYKSYLYKGLAEDIPFKGAGLKYIQFAKDEPQLFKILCMGSGDGQTTHFMPSYDENYPAVENALISSWNMNEKNAKKIYNHLAVYAHGLAVLYAQGQCVFTMEDVDKMLTEVFMALKKATENNIS